MAKTGIKRLVDDAFEAQRKVADAVEKLIEEAKEKLKTERIGYTSRNKYDDDNKFECATLRTIDGVFFDENDLRSVDHKEVEDLVKKLSKNPNAEDLDPDVAADESERVAIYCIKKKIKPKDFLEACDALLEVSGLPLPMELVISMSLSDIVEREMLKRATSP